MIVVILRDKIYPNKLTRKFFKLIFLSLINKKNKMRKNKNFIIVCTITLLFFNLSQCYSQNKVLKKSVKISNKSISAYFIGKFNKLVETEETTSGTASIHYYFTITKDKVKLETITYHEPIMCNGEYIANEKGNILELVYTGKEKNCFSKKPDFLIKREKNKYYIKGLGGEGSINVWLELKKEN